MRIYKIMSEENGEQLLQAIRTDIAKRFMYQGETNDADGNHIEWANIQDVKTCLNGEICDLEEFQSGMGGNNIEARVISNENQFILITAWSGFKYELVEDADCWFISYEGAWNGLCAQNVLPKPLAVMNWQGSKIESSLSDRPVSWDEYKEIRKAKGLDV